MHFTHIISALAAWTAFASAAPALVEKDTMPVERGLKHTTRAQKRGNVIIQQTVAQPNIVIVNQNLGAINNLARLAELELLALVRSQVTLLQTIEAIKNNIRINTFRSRFTQVNTVIVTVTKVVDLRNRNAQNNRYMVNQLVADNGRPDKEVVVMISAADEMTIGLPTPTGAAAAAAAEVSAAAAAGPDPANPTGTPQIAAFDPAAPFGRSNQSVLLPFGSQAPTLPNRAQIFADPAAIILPGARNLFVEDISRFSADCALWGANGNSLFNLQSALLAAGQVANAQLAGLVLGGGLDANLANQLLNGGKGRANTNSNANNANQAGNNQTSAAAPAAASATASAKPAAASVNPTEG